LTFFYTEIKQIIKEARAKAYNAVNYAMVEAYWLIGRRIVEEIQNGEHRANYGEQVIKNVSKALTAEFGRGFSERSIWQYRQFYQMFPKLPIRRSMIADSGKKKLDSAIADRGIAENLLHPLSWTHIQRIMRVLDLKARAWYLLEAAEPAHCYLRFPQLLRLGFLFPAFPLSFRADPVQPCLYRRPLCFRRWLVPCHSR
jgi:hypothetical protein